MASDRRKLPKDKEIRAYWADDELWYQHGVEPVSDIMEPRLCMACSVASGTQRCHIVSRHNGGPDTVDNLHCLCNSCHHASEFLEGAQYWRWIKTQNIYSNADAFNAWFARRGMSVAKMASLSQEDKDRGHPVIQSLHEARRASGANIIDALDAIGIDISL